MTDEDAKQIADAFVGPVREVLERVMALVERLTNRVEVLELERLHRQPAAGGNDDLH
jgi:hypothetical protein